MRRAEDFHHWCGNGRDNEQANVAATHMPTMTTQVYALHHTLRFFSSPPRSPAPQVYHPTACDSSWSLYHRHCYVHVWEAKTWWEAEAW